jgi:biofilm PGA synthesis protein PgaD
MTEQEHVSNNPDDLLENYPENLIIDRPDLKSMPFLLGEQLLTLIFWGFWFYLWLPLISILAWAFGFHILYSHIVALGGFEGFLKQLHVFFGGIFFASGILALWSLYNLKRYGAYNRRTEVFTTDHEALEKFFSLSSDQLRTMHQAKRLTVSFSEDGSITGVLVTTIPAHRDNKG